MADQRSPVVGFDLDSGAGSFIVQGVTLRLSANGGPIEAIGQQVMAASIPVVLASNHSTIPVSIAATVTVDTELPAAAAATDAFANPTAPGVLAFNFGWNGSTWDRLKSTTANGLAVDVTRVTGTVTVDTLDFPAAAALSDAFANPTTTQVGAMLMGWNTATWDRLRSTTANGLVVDVSRVQGTVTVDSELPAAAALANATANPTVPGVGAFLMGWNTATWDRVAVANTGRLQVDVITGGGGASPTAPINKYVTSAALAAGSAATLSTGEIGAKRLTAVEVWASVAYKAELRKVLNAVVDTDPSVIGGGQAFQSFAWKTPHPDYVATTASAGLDEFRVTVTNLDDANPADVYASFHYET